MTNRRKNITQETKDVVNTFFEFKDLIERERKKYEESYLDWCEKHPGYVMQNDGIREIACKEMLELCTSYEDLKFYADKHFKQWEEMSSPNGHYVIYNTYLDVIKLIRNERYKNKNTRGETP